jgi:hypothetical protein
MCNLEYTKRKRTKTQTQTHYSIAKKKREREKERKNCERKILPKNNQQQQRLEFQ